MYMYLRPNVKTVNLFCPFDLILPMTGQRELEQEKGGPWPAGQARSLYTTVEVRHSVVGGPAPAAGAADGSLEPGQAAQQLAVVLSTLGPVVPGRPVGERHPTPAQVTGHLHTISLISPLQKL